MKNTFATVLFVLIALCFLNGFCEAEDATVLGEISGTIQEAGIVAGTGNAFVTLKELPDKAFMINENQAKKMGFIEMKDGNKIYRGGSVIGRKVHLRYENIEKERYGRRYHIVISLERE